MGKGYRRGRLAGEIQKTIAGMLVSEIKDPRLANRIITVSGVDVTSDGSYAFIYVTPLVLKGEDSKTVYDEVIDAFHNAGGIFRSKIAKDYRLRYAPELVFRIDDSENYGRHIDELIKSVHKEENEKDNGNVSD